MNMNSGKKTSNVPKQPDLPDPSGWRPTKAKNQLLISEALLHRCSVIEKQICAKVKAERSISANQFDSGLPTEDIVRKGLAELLPSRYSVLPGVVVDNSGASAGEMDIVIFNDTWFPEAHPPATEKTRRTLLPFEGVYAVGEVKQTLTFESLDKGLEKLVKCHRLNRGNTARGRITENRDSNTVTKGLSNPLYSFIIGATAKKADIQPLIERFFAINELVQRLEVVRALCILNEGAVTWAIRDDSGGGSPALFMNEDLELPIVPAYWPAGPKTSPFYILVENLMLHLYHSVLAPEDLVSLYGPSERIVKLPESMDIKLKPDS